MPPVNQKTDTKTTWKERNKLRKEQKKKWKDEKLMRQEKKIKLAENIEISDQNAELDSRKVSTISFAVPGSILDNAQTAELRTYLAGQIARAASIFQVDEIVVFDDLVDVSPKKDELIDIDGLKTARKCCVQLARILQYLECPQYLRKFFFPIHNDLQYAGLINPLDSPNHLRQSNSFIFREGVVTNKPVKAGRGSSVNVGLLQDAIVDKVLTPGLRVTVQILPSHGKKIRGKIVSPTTPRSTTGIYWGYNVRIAKSLSQVFTQSPFKKGYDLTIGTSERGTSIDEITSLKYKHVLVVFGGLQGLEVALESDDQLQMDDPSLIFDHYLNVLPEQGSRTIRTEEAILITLTALRPKLAPKYPRLKFVGYEQYQVGRNSE